MVSPTCTAFHHEVSCLPVQANPVQKAIEHLRRGTVRDTPASISYRRPTRFIHHIAVLRRVRHFLIRGSPGGSHITPCPCFTRPARGFASRYYTRLA